MEKPHYFIKPELKIWQMAKESRFCVCVCVCVYVWDWLSAWIMYSYTESDSALKSLCVLLHSIHYSPILSCWCTSVCFILLQRFWKRQITCASERKLASLCGVLLKKWSREDANLVWKGSYQMAAVEFGFVFSLHEESQQLPFPLDKYGPPPNETKAILLQYVVAVLHHLRAE